MRVSECYEYVCVCLEIGAMTCVMLLKTLYLQMRKIVVFISGLSFYVCCGVLFVLLSGCGDVVFGV